jgi:nucleoside-diphosphate-sugar epimerase
MPDSDTTDVAIDVYASFPNYNNQVLELGSGVEISVKSSITLLEQAMGQSLEVVHLAMRRGEIDGTRLRANITRLRELTGFHPQVNLDKGLNQTVDYYRRHLHLIDAGVL